MTTFNHNILVTHGLTLDAEGKKAVLFKLVDAKLKEEITVTDVFEVTSVVPQALNVIMASVHMYQMIQRNSIGLNHIKKEIEAAVWNKAIGPIFAKEVCGWIDELQQLNGITKLIALEGSEAAEKKLKEAQQKSKPTLKIVT